MILRYRYGSPISTGGTVLRLPPAEGNPEEFVVSEGAFSCPLGPRDVVYGLGETVRGLNKRGWEYVSYCTDESRHTEDKHSLYAAHNFILVQRRGGDRFGAFFDYGGRISFNIGYSPSDQIIVRPREMDLGLYILKADSCAEILRELRRLTGRSYIPPKWGFGVGQSRWGYQNQGDVRKVIAEYARRDYPLEYVCLDIDYMRDYADFTVDRERFPDLAALGREALDQGVRLVPIIDAGIRIEAGEPTYQEGKAGGYYVKDAQGRDFVGAVWPGLVHFPDVLNPAARRWFASCYRVLTDMGIEGFWNDMNEPALFYTPKGLERLRKQMAASAREDMGIAAFDLIDAVMELGNNPADYADMRHTMEGGLVEHERVHNLYGGNFLRASGEGLAALLPEKRTLLFARSSFIGAHRYGGIWFGDNSSWWEHILLSFQLLANAGMCGFLFCGGDVGGFNCDASEELVLRWTQMALFSPLMRNHSARGTLPQEPYRFQGTEAFGRVLGLRYSLLPYIYSEFMKAALEDGLLLRPLAFDYPEDSMAPEVEDQLLFGSELMLCPVYTQNARGRNVYLPEEMRLIVFRDWEHYRTELMERGWHYVPVDMDETAVFLRKGCLLPLAAPARNTGELRDQELTLIRYREGDGAVYRMYRDDGFTRDYDNPRHWSVLG